MSQIFNSYLYYFFPSYDTKILIETFERCVFRPLHMLLKQSSLNENVAVHYMHTQFIVFYTKLWGQHITGEVGWAVVSIYNS